MDMYKCRRFNNQDPKIAANLDTYLLGTAAASTVPHAWRAWLYIASSTLSGPRSAGHAAETNPLPAYYQPTTNHIAACPQRHQNSVLAFTPRRSSCAGHDMLAPAVDSSAHRFRAGLRQSSHGGPPCLPTLHTNLPHLLARLVIIHITTAHIATVF
jgi:hypothetical protein